jgi:hypothetical protein
MIKLAETLPIYMELYQALAHFVARQQMVIRAVIELGVRPETLGQGVGAWRDKTPQVGTWGDEWEFFFHGGGCELRHVHTGEPIDWNGPDPLAFGRMSFLHHLEWRLESESGLPELHAFVSEHDLVAVLDLIQELIEGGVVTPDCHIEPGTAAQQAA